MDKLLFIIFSFFQILVFAQTSNLDIAGNSKLQLYFGSSVCVDDLNVHEGSTLKADDYGQIKYSDCTVILEPVGDGAITLNIEQLDNISIPTEFVIDSAYPNPFNPSINIKYGIPDRGLIRIVLYNLKGQLIKELFKNTQEAGWYNIVWSGVLDDGSKASTGLYILKIHNTTNSNTGFKSIKISLIK